MQPGSGTDRIQNHVERIVSILLKFRNLAKFLLTAGIFVGSYITAYLLRFELVMHADYLSLIVTTLPLLLVAKSVGFLSFDLYRGWWRYVSLRDVPSIVAGCTFGSILFAVGAYTFHSEIRIPRSMNEGLR